MSFRELIESSAQSEEFQQNILTDGQQSCSYQAMPGVFDQIDQAFRAHAISPGDCVSFECPNTVPGALVLLYLIAHGHHFVLIPPVDEAAAKGAEDLKPVPHFCQYCLAVNSDRAVPNQSPEQFLRIARNPQYNGLRVAETHGSLKGAIYLRTSGSMGTSKLVVHSHERLLANAHNCVQKYRFQPVDRVVIPVPIAHMYGCGAALLPATMVCASVDLQEKSNLLKYLAREKRFHPNIAFVTPPLCEMLLHAFRVPRNYKAIVTSGQRINNQLFREFNDRVGNCLVNQYGSSEMGAIAACDPNDPLDLKDKAIGRPMDGVQLRIHSPQPESGVGELQCWHPFGFLGYVDDEGAWLTQVQPDEWYSTGDVAHQDAKGDISVIGRAQNSVNRDGRLVLFSDIERAMEQIEQIKQVAVVASTAETRRGQRLTAFCVPDSEAVLESLQVRTRCFNRLPKYAIPDDVRIVDSLPLLPSGKCDQRRLQEMADVLVGDRQHAASGTESGIGSCLS